MTVRDFSSLLPPGRTASFRKNIDTLQQIREKCAELRTATNRQGGENQVMNALIFAAMLEGEDGPKDSQGNGDNTNSSTHFDTRRAILANPGDDVDIGGRADSDGERRHDEGPMFPVSDRDPVALAAPHGRHGRDLVPTVPSSSPAGSQDTVADICRWVIRLYASDGHDGKRGVTMQVANDVLPDTRVSVSEEGGRLGVVFDCARSTTAESLCGYLPSLAHDLSRALSRDVVARVAIAVPVRRCLLETHADAPDHANEPGLDLAPVKTV